MSAGRLLAHRRTIIECIGMSRPIPHELREPLARLIEAHLARLRKRSEGRHGR